MLKTRLQRVGKKITKGRISYLFILPYCTLFFIFTVLPVLASIFLSFTNFNMLEVPEWNGINNYLSLFLDDDIFLQSVGNTLVMAAIVGPGGYLLSLFLAWLINDLSPKVRYLFTLIFYAPSISGNVFMIWKVLFSSDVYGYLNGILMKLGLITEPIQWLANPDYMMGCVIIVSLWLSLSTSFLSFIAGLQGIDRVMYEAAAIEGMRNRWQELWYVTLPAIKPQLMFGAVMSISSAFTVGDIGKELCGFPSAGYAVDTMMNRLDDFGSIKYEMGYASAIATILFIMMLLANVFIRKFLNKIGA